MTRVAALDCGTNSLRLLVADISGQGASATLTDVHRDMRVVRLGQGVDRTGELSSGALERTRAALAEYGAVAARLGAERTRLVATSATRDARNREAFVQMVQQTLGVLPEVVSGDEEAALSFDGSTRALDPAAGPFLVVDIGGGSTEFVLGSDRVEAALSVDVGCVRLTERHLASDPPTAAEVAAAEADVDDALLRVRAVVPVERARVAVGLAGSVTTVAAHVLQLPAYVPERIHHALLPADDLVRSCTELLAMTRAERAALPYMAPGRADVIGAGALLLRTLVARLEWAEVLASEADILDGIAWSAAR